MGKGSVLHLWYSLNWQSRSRFPRETEFVCRICSQGIFAASCCWPLLQWGSSHTECPDALADVTFWVADCHDVGHWSWEPCVRVLSLSMRRFWRTAVYRCVCQARARSAPLDPAPAWLSPWADLTSVFIFKYVVFTTALPGRVPRVSPYMPCLTLRTNPRDRYCDFYFMDPNMGASPCAKF